MPLLRTLLRRPCAIAGAAVGWLFANAAAAGAQTVPATAATPPPVTGPALGANDSCTSLAAIVSRPSQTTSVCTVRPGHVLIETGYQNTIAAGAATTASYPQAFVRIGTAVPALELDAIPPQDERLRTGGVTSTATTDVGFGLKYVLGASPRCNDGAAAFFTAPTGSPALSAGVSTAAYDVNVGCTLGPVLSVAGTLGYDALALAGRRYASVIPSLVLTAGFANATGIFVEGAGFTNGAGPGTPVRLQLLGGITRGLTPRSQIDLEVGGSPTTSTGAYHFIGFGASYYF